MAETKEKSQELTEEELKYEKKKIFKKTRSTLLLKLFRVVESLKERDLTDDEVFFIFEETFEHENEDDYVASFENY